MSANSSSWASTNSIVPEVLNYNNYKIWSSCMKDYLLGQDLWDVVTSEDEPEAESVAHEAESSEAEELTSRSSISYTSKKDWRKKNALALHAIKMSCIPYFRFLISEVDTAKKAWDLLTSKIMKKKSKSIAEEEDKAALGKEYDLFIKATKSRDWTTMKTFLDSHHKALAAPVFNGGRTALHHALFYGYKDLAVLLVNEMSPEDLEIQDEDGFTTLNIGATHNFPSQLHLLELMVKKNPKLANIGTIITIPVATASWKGFKDTTRFLYHVTDKSIMSPENGKMGVNLLINFINTKLFDIALDLVKQYPKLLQQDYGEVYPIYALAKTFSTFTAGSGHKISREKQVSQVYTNEHKLIHTQAHAFLQLVCYEVSTLDSSIYVKTVYGAMLKATKDGTIEFINEMLRVNPRLIYANNNNTTLFWYAVENRQECVFNLIYGAYEWKDVLLSKIDKDKNNILHLVAMLADAPTLKCTSGAVLQMQRELQWFEEVWNVAKPRYREDLNNDKLTPRQLFTKSHKNLMEAGEKSMKDTAQSSTVVGALIVTIMFAAAFTVPGGNNEETGLPLFLKKIMFKIFIVCDALSLYSSTTSVLVFLAILTSRYAEDDFLFKLPKQLMIGLSSLFFSITTMMIAFCTALTLMLDGQLQFIFPVVLLAFVPVIIFLSSILPLLHEIFMATFGPSIFDRNTKLPGEKEEGIEMITCNPPSTDQFV